MKTLRKESNEFCSLQCYGNRLSHYSNIWVITTDKYVLIECNQSYKKLQKRFVNIQNNFEVYTY